MTVIEGTIDIDAPVPRVWAIVSDPRNLPLWDHRVLKVADFPDGGLRAGSLYRVQMGFMGARAWVPATVLELDPGKCSRIHLGGLVDAVIETKVAPLNSGGTRLTHRIEYRFMGGPLGSIAAGAVRHMGAPMLLRHGMQAQKRQAEAG